MCSRIGNRRVRAPDEIDGELRLLALLRRTTAEHGGPLPSIAVIDELLDVCADAVLQPGVDDDRDW